MQQSVVLAEHAPELALDDRYGALARTQTRRYGRTAVSVYEPSSKTEAE